MIFHMAFEEYLASSKFVVSEEERILAALQQTWEEYKADPEHLQEHLSIASGAHPSTGAGVAVDAVPPCLAPSAVPASRFRLVPPDDLAEAFGEGYGDMSEALALMQDELSQSTNPAAKRLAEMIIMVPLVVPGDSSALPAPSDAQALLEEWQAAATPLIAVDLSVSRPGKECNLELAKLWVPGGSPAADVGQHIDGRPGRHLVALVCYMWQLQHYVAFCRRQSEPTRCVFFNDLPDVTRGAAREVEWRDVPEMCGTYGLTPRLALYESCDVADAASRDPATVFG